MRMVRFCVGLLLTPLCWVSTWTLVSLLMSIKPAVVSRIPLPAWGPVIGFLLWQTVHFTVPPPVRTYVLAHELTHALWGAIMGARVSRLKIAKDSGSVELSKINWFIALAPYFFPLYTVLVIVVYYALAIRFEVQRAHFFWLALIGFTWGFHLNFTIGTLLQRQSDIRRYGHLFSYALIYLLNVLGVCFWVVMVSSATLEAMVADLGAHGRVAAGWLWAIMAPLDR